MIVDPPIAKTICIVMANAWANLHALLGLSLFMPLVAVLLLSIVMALLMPLLAMMPIVMASLLPIVAIVIRPARSSTPPLQLLTALIRQCTLTFLLL